jgi:hypothetical protein
VSIPLAPGGPGMNSEVNRRAEDAGSWTFGSEIQLKRICDGAVLQVIGRLAHIVEVIFDSWAGLSFG